MQREVIEKVKQIRKGNVPLGYKRTKLGVLPSEWSICSIGECLTKVESPVNVQPNKQYTQIGIRSHGKGLFYKEPVSGKSLGNKPVFWIEPNCFVLNIVFAWEQAIGKTTQSEVGMIGSHRFPMYRPVNEKIDINYLIAFLMTKRGKEILEAASPGGAGRNRTLGQARFMKSRIVCPPIAEQRKITAILSSQDMLIEKKEKLLAEKLKRKKFLMQQLLTGRVRLPGFPTHPMKKTKLGQVPEDWVVIRLGKVFRICHGKPQKKVVHEQGKYPILATGGQIGRSSQYLYNKESVLIGRKGTIDKPQFATEPFWTVDTLFYTKIKESFSPRMIFYCCCQIKWKKFNEGSGVPSLNAKTIAGISIMLPPSIFEQQAIAHVLSAADREVELLQHAIMQEKRNKKALMQLLLTGIVRV